MAGRVEHVPNHETGGGFAIGAGNADDAKVFGGMVIFGSSNNSLRPVIGKDGGVVEWEFFE